MKRSLLGEGGQGRKETEQHMQRLWSGREPDVFEELENRAMVIGVQRGG